MSETDNSFKYPFLWMRRLKRLAPKRGSIYGPTESMHVRMPCGLLRLLEEAQSVTGKSLAQVVAGFVEDGMMASRADWQEKLQKARTAEKQRELDAFAFDWSTLDSDNTDETYTEDRDRVNEEDEEIYEPKDLP